MNLFPTQFERSNRQKNNQDLHPLSVSQVIHMWMTVKQFKWKKQTLKIIKICTSVRTVTLPISNFFHVYPPYPISSLFIHRVQAAVNYRHRLVSWSGDRSHVCSVAPHRGIRQDVGKIIPWPLFIHRENESNWSPLLWSLEWTDMSIFFSRAVFLCQT